MMRLSSILVLAAAAALPGCGVLRGGGAGAGAGGAEAPAGPPPPSADAFVDEGLLVPGRTRGELETALGTPVEVRAVAIPNRHDPAVVDTVIAWSYPGIVLHLHQVGSGGPEFLSDVEVTSNRYLRWPAVGIGAARDRVRAYLGPSGEDNTEPEVDLYVCGTCLGPPEPVRFYYGGDGRVIRILFSFYVD